MDGTVKVSDVAPGDVILYKGTSFISHAIRFFDGTDFSHAALYLGEGMVGEAVSTGIERRTLEEGAAGIWVQAHRLKDVVPTMAPVLDTANTYLDQGNRYGYEQLLLLAFLCLTRKLRFTPSLRLLVRTVLDAAAASLTRLLSEHREPMICSEFVYRTYSEALPGSDDVYSLWINRLAAPAVSLEAVALLRPSPLAEARPMRGQGIHPQSLLSLLNSSSGSAWVGSPPTDGTLAAPARPEPDQGDLDPLVEAYLSEVQAGPERLGRTLAPPEPTLEDLRAATDSFAVNLYTACHPEEARTPSLSAPADATLVSTHLAQTAADFVTPGDLYKTQSLYLLGRIEMD